MKQIAKYKTNQTRRGSALILVVVVTVLLAVVGIMFLMIARVGDIMAAAAGRDYEMDQAVQTVTGKIEQVLMQDLFGYNLANNLADGRGASNEPFDAPGVADPWLASLEPEWIGDNGTPDDPDDDLYRWPYISKLIPAPNNWDRIIRDGHSGWALPQHSGIVPDYQPASEIFVGAPADADGDGVADSVWIPMFEPAPGGEVIYAAVRIIDNGAMLNLNTAHRTRIASAWTGQGRWLSEVDYEAILRGNDRALPDMVRKARLTTPPPPAAANDSFDDYHENVIMHIENPYAELLRKWEELGSPAPKPLPVYTLFDLGDELEMRNRFLLTSRAQARFEQITDTSGAPYIYGLYETFDYERGEFTGGWNVPLRVKRIPVDSSDDLRIWKQRMNPDNLDASDPANTYGYYYDRRHVCTFYSFDRNLRYGTDPFAEALTDAEKEIYGKLFTPADGRPVSVRRLLFPEDDPDPAVALQNQYKVRRHILHLLYAFRAYYGSQGNTRAAAARKAARIVANMIDYFDDRSDETAQTGPFSAALFGSQYDSRPTYITQQIINRMIAETSANLSVEDPSVPFFAPNSIPAAFAFGLDAADVIYGYERQPFISELYIQRTDITNNTAEVALELLNPYDTAISLENWRILFDRKTGSSTDFDIPAGVTIPAGSPSVPGRLTIRSNDTISTVGTARTIGGFGLGTLVDDANSIDLQRPDPRDAAYATNPTQFITVDRIERGRFLPMLSDNPADGVPTLHALKRQDTGWRFTNAEAFVHEQSPPLPANPATLGLPNAVPETQTGWQMPVADELPPLPGLPDERRFYTLADFQKVLFIGSQSVADPNAVSLTASVANASEEGEIRFDILRDPDLLGYICFLDRDRGSLPGRININTAPEHVLAAAIQAGDPLPFAQAIVDGRTAAGYESVGDLLNLTPWDTPSAPDDDDASVSGDLQERDWLLTKVSNILTTRSDVFTAYILVRIGTDGPQRRVMAIFDRSRVWTSEDRPRIIAIKTIPNPR